MKLNPLLWAKSAASLARAAFRGVAEAVRAELNRPACTSLDELVRADVCAFFLPFTGAVQGVRAELAARAANAAKPAH